MDRTDSKIDTQLTRGSSRVVRYELVDKDGRPYEGTQFTNAMAAADFARRLWPDQEQDPDRTRKGWDIRVVGS